MLGRCAHTLARPRATVRRTRLRAPPRDPLARCDCRCDHAYGRRYGPRVLAPRCPRKIGTLPVDGA